MTDSTPPAPPVIKIDAPHVHIGMERKFLLTAKCICGKRVRVYDILPDRPLCRACETEITRAEAKMQKDNDDDE